LDKTVQRVPFLRLSIALATGILLGTVIRISPFILLVTTVLLLCGLIRLNRRYQFHLTALFGAGIHIIFVFTGMVVFVNRNKKPCFHEEGKFCAAVSGIMQEKPNSYQTVLRIQAVRRNDTMYRCDEKVLTWFAKSQRARELCPGDHILFNLSPEIIENDNNPYEFDNRKYLARRRIYRQLYLPEDKWSKSGLSAGYSLSVFAERVRLHLLEIYRRQIPGEKALNILSSLTLGYRQGLSPEVKQTFSTAGVMHVLAVSGLHTGILFLMISFLLGFMKRWKAGRLIFVLVSIAVLWFFAFFTGLSPSVKRAATMFSFVAVGEGLKRRSNIYNTLAASAFFLLLFNPNNLFDVGFQLSYTAVFGIVFLHPLMDKIIPARNRIVRYGWSLITVTVSAQVATFPLSAYYFHQFPVYGWLSNILVIPAVTLLIPMGMALLLFCHVPVLTTLIADVVNLILQFMIHFLERIERLPFSVLEFSFSKVEMAFVLSLFLCTFCFIKTMSIRHFKVTLLFFLFLISSSLAIKTYNLFRREMIVYNHSGQTIIHLISGRRNYIVSEKKIEEGGVAGNMVGQTVCRLELRDPVFLTADQLYRDSRLFLKGGMIFFEGKVIALGKNPDTEYFNPHFLIGTYSGKHARILQSPDQQIVSTLRSQKDFLTDCSPVFFLYHEGAFRENW
jgi:competence protein ComEC